MTSLLGHLPSTYHIFKDKGERLPRVYDVVQCDYVRVLQFLEQGRLSDRGERSALLLLQSNLF